MGSPIATVGTPGVHSRRTIGHTGLEIAAMLFPLLLSFAPARAQTVEPAASTTSFSVSASLGFNTFALDDVRNFYSDLLDVYRTNGVPIPTQREFPGNMIVGLSVLYTIPSVANIGLGSRYTWTRAFSSYEDYAGRANVNGKISMVTLEGIIQRDFVTESIVDIYVGARGGLVFGWSEFSQSIVFNDYPDQNFDILLSGTGRGYTVEGFIGVKRRIDSIVLGVCTGYRYANVSDMDGDLSLNGQSQGSGTLQLKHDLSGFTLSAHIDFVLE